MHIALCLNSLIPYLSMQDNVSLLQKVGSDGDLNDLIVFDTICNLCSVGCKLRVKHLNGRVDSVTGATGLINDRGQKCSYPDKAYNRINSFQRITKPLKKVDNKHIEISWDEAFAILHEQILLGPPEDKAFFAGARLTNEEQYLIQKIARGVAYSNNIGSFHYLGRGTGYTKLSRANIPFAELTEAAKIYIIGAEVYRDNPVAADFIFNNQNDNNIPVTVVTNNPESYLVEKAKGHIIIKSYFHFVRAINKYIIDNELEDKEYIKNLVENFSDYRNSLMKENLIELLGLAGIEENVLKQFADEFINESHAVLVFSENELSSHTCGEVFNLAMLTGKHGRTGAGLMLLKENNNSHGLHDIGVMWNLGPGATPWDDPFQRSTVQFIWGSEELPDWRGCSLTQFIEKGYKSLFIFGEDPIGCAIDETHIRMLMSKSSFIMVQELHMTATAQIADLIMPASFPFETGGTYTNCQRVIQKVDKRIASPVEYTSWRQLEELLIKSGYKGFDSVDDVTFEIASLLPKFCTSSKLMFRMKDKDNYNLMFRYGCNDMLSIKD